MDTDADNPSPPTEDHGDPSTPTENDGRPSDTPVKKRRVGLNVALAILAICERKQVSYHVDYRSMAARFNMGAAALRNLYALYKAGRLELPPDITGPHSKHDDRELMVRAREVARRDLALCLAAHEGAVFTAEDALGTKGRMGKKRSEAKMVGLAEVFKDLHFMRREVESAIRLVHLADEGFNEYLQAQEAERMRLSAPKPANPDKLIPPAIQDAVGRLSDHERGLEALRRQREKEQAVELQVVTPSQ